MVTVEPAELNTIGAGATNKASVNELEQSRGGNFGYALKVIILVNL